MSNKKIIKEKNDFIFKYQKQNVNEKLANILGQDFRKYREDFNKTQDYLETKFIPDFPITISLELVNRCNLNCIMCYKDHHLKPQASLSLRVLEKVMQECKDNKLPSLNIGLGAEPLVYKDIKQAMDIINKADIQDIFFGTNGALLTDELIELMVKNKISRIKITLDAATRAIYNKVRRVPVFDKVEENIEKIIAYKKKYNQELPIIRLSFVVMDINKHETELFIEKWKDKVDCIDFQRHIDLSYIDKAVKINQTVIKDAFCAYPFYSLNIWSNGDVGPCCSFYARKLVFGNIHNQTLKDIWQNQAMKIIQKQIALKKFNPSCQKCLYFRDRDLIDNL